MAKVGRLLPQSYSKSRMTQRRPKKEAINMILLDSPLTKRREAAVRFADYLRVDCQIINTRMNKPQQNSQQV